MDGGGRGGGRGGGGEGIVGGRAFHFFMDGEGRGRVGGGGGQRNNNNQCQWEKFVIKAKTRCSQIRLMWH